MNVYIDGLGYSEDERTHVAMRVIRSASLMIGCELDKFGVTLIEAADFLEKYFDAVIKQHGPQAIENIERVFNALSEYEKKYMPQVTDDWPSSKQVRDHFDAYLTGGKQGLYKTIEENNKRSG